MYVKVHHVVRSVFHIGVGSNVVCSAIPGNAKASSGGTGSKEVPTFFFVLVTLITIANDQLGTEVINVNVCNTMITSPNYF